MISSRQHLKNKDLIQQEGTDENGQGSGWEYMDNSGNWHHTSTLKPNSPTFNEKAAADTHIQLP
jgi:hypothetical protein